MGGGIFSTQLLARISTSHLWEWVRWETHRMVSWWLTILALTQAWLVLVYLWVGLVVVPPTDEVSTHNIGPVEKLEPLASD